MRIVVALDERTLLKSGAFEVSESRSTNVQAVARALADLAQDHQVIVAHGNGLQENLLTMQTAACLSDGLSNIEMLLTETEGMIGYLIEQELLNALPEGADLATIVTRIEVDRNDPAFDKPTNAVGPSFSAACAKIMQDQHGWTMAGNAQGRLSRMIPSPLPRAPLSSRMIEQLADSGACVICSGGGRPVFRNEAGMMEGVAAIVDKD